MTIGSSSLAKAQDIVPRVDTQDVSIIEGDASARSVAAIEVTLTVVSPRTVTVQYATADGTATGAGEFRDYVPTSGTLTFAPGDTRKTVWVRIVVDARVEGNETFEVDLTDATNAVLREAQAVVTIVDDDSPGGPRVPELAISDVSVREGGTQGVVQATFDVTLSATADHPVFVDYSTADGTASGLSNTAAMEIPETGEAGLASLYPSTISVPATEGVLTDVNVSLTGLSHPYARDLDVLLEGPDGTTVVLMSDVQCYLKPPNLSVVDLTFDDAWPAMRDHSCLERSHSAPTNYGSSADSFPFPAPQTTPGTALSWFNGTNPTGNWNLYVVDDERHYTGRLAGGWSLSLTTAGSRVEDYHATAGTVMLPAGQSSRTVSVEVVGDHASEADEAFQVLLVNPINARISDGQGIATILDDDGAAPWHPRIAINDVAVVEGDTRAVFDVSLSAAFGQPITVDYSTVDGSATGASNVAELSNTAAMEIPETGEAGLASLYPSTISVPATEGVLTDVNVSLTGLSHPYARDLDVLLEGPDGTTVVLMSDVQCYLKPPNLSVVDLTFDDAWPAMRDHSCLERSHSAPTNYGSSADSFPFPAPQTTPGTALSWFNGTNPTGNWNLYVVDDERHYTGRLAGGWSLSLTMAGDSDYGPASGTVTFAPGTIARTISIDVSPDAWINESPETFRVNLGDASDNALLGDAWGIATVFDDDGTTDGTNEAPTAVGALADRTLYVGDSAAVGLAAAFKDPEDDLLTYRATSSANGVASVSTSGALLMVTPVAGGTATITVTATDVGGSNATATRTFRATVTPECSGATCLLQRERFRVKAWYSKGGRSQAARAIATALGASAALFTADSASPELLVRIVNRCRTSGWWEVYAGVASDASFSIAIRDTETNALKWFRSRGRSVVDTEAFACTESDAGAMAAGVMASGASAESDAMCTGATCLFQDRLFRVKSWYRGDAGSSQTADAVPVGLGGSTGLFAFASGNPELLVRIVDTCSSSGYWTVYAGAASDADFRVAIRHVGTNELKWFRSRGGQTVADASAFACGDR